ncbi:MAG TPA: HAD family hydrolase [Thermoanaerobacterales bacterium]|nr:HAD family hydrolase [Thermoanaerobacterales bacterium]
MKYEAVLFDLDGTLLDTLQDLADSMNSVLSRRGFPVHDIEKYRYFVGDGMYNLVLRTLPPNNREEEIIKQCLKELKDEYGRRWANTTRPYEGICELLDKLSDMGLKKAVLSNKPHDFTRLIIDKLLPDWSFDAVVGQREGVPKKPDPTAALAIADALKIPPEKFLYLGDTNTDMKTANAAGMYAVGALWGFREAEELVESGAKVLIKHPKELLNILS